MVTTTIGIANHAADTWRNRVAPWLTFDEAHRAVREFLDGSRLVELHPFSPRHRTYGWTPSTRYALRSDQPDIAVVVDTAGADGHPIALTVITRDMADATLADRLPRAAFAELAKLTWRSGNRTEDTA